jgi:hypothetical protein
MKSIEPDYTKASKVELFLDTPFIITLTGSGLILCGVIILLIASFYLPRGEQDNIWMSFWGMVIVCCGGTLYAISTFVNSPIFISFGGVFLTTGLSLYTASLAWQLHDSVKDIHTQEMITNNNERRRGILGTIAMLITLFGIFFFVTKAIQRMVRPYFGPANYNLYGSLIFGAGAFSYLLLNISTTNRIKVKSVIERSYIYIYIYTYFLFN